MKNSITIIGKWWTIVYPNKFSNKKLHLKYYVNRTMSILNCDTTVPDQSVAIAPDVNTCSPLKYWSDFVKSSGICWCFPVVQYTASTQLFFFICFITKQCIVWNTLLRKISLLFKYTASCHIYSVSRVSQRNVVVPTLSYRYHRDYLLWGCTPKPRKPFQNPLLPDSLSPTLCIILDKLVLRPYQSPTGYSLKLP